MSRSALVETDASTMTSHSDPPLGVLARSCLRAAEQGGRDAVRRRIEQARELSAEELNDCANELARAGAMALAQLAYEEAMRRDLSSAKLLANLGRALVAQGRFAEGASWLCAAAERAPSSLPTARSTLRALEQAGRRDDAASLASRLVGAGLEPQLFALLSPPREQSAPAEGSPEAGSSAPGAARAVERARALARQGRREHAAELIDALIEDAPFEVAAWLARSDFAVGAEAQARVLEQLTATIGDGASLDAPALLIEAARLCDELGQRARCRAFLDRAAQLFPDAPFVASALADSAADAGELDEAVRLCERAVGLAPEEPHLRARLAYHLVSAGRPGRALELLEQSLRRAPFTIELHQARLMTSLYVEGPDHRAAHDEFGELFGEVEQPLGAPAPSAGRRRLRVGYLSADFCDHPVGRFVFPILAGHDRSRFEVYCYSATRRLDAYTARIRGLDLVFRDVRGLGERGLAQQIRRDEIDVLVDLSGHSHGTRLRALAWKPAAAQLSYLGYAHGTGLDQMDFRVSDEVADPSGASISTDAERVWRLPHTAWTYDAPVSAPPAAWRGDASAPRLVAHHNPAKISPRSIDLWAEILRRLPQATLNLGSRAALVREHYEREFRRRQVDPARLVFPPRLPMGEHYAALSAAHLALDAFPYHGTTTTADALWAGLPVVTRLGETHVARVGASLLAAVELDELVAPTDEIYVERAVAWATDPSRRETIGRELRERLLASPLGDGARFTRSFEAALLGARDAVEADPERRPCLGDRRRVRLPDGVYVLPSSLRHPSTFSTLEHRGADAATRTLAERLASRWRYAELAPVDARRSMAFASRTDAAVEIVDGDEEKRRCFDASFAASGVEDRARTRAGDPTDLERCLGTLDLRTRPAICGLGFVSAEALALLAELAPGSLAYGPRPHDRDCDALTGDGWCVLDWRPGAGLWSRSEGLGDPRAEASLWVPREQLDRLSARLPLHAARVDAALARAAQPDEALASLEPLLFAELASTGACPLSLRFLATASLATVEPAVRVASLERAWIEARLELLERPRSLPRTLTAARLSLALGRRSDAVDLLGPWIDRPELLEEGRHLSDEEVCLAPVAGFRSPRLDELGPWCVAQAIAVSVLTLSSCLPHAPTVLGMLRQLARTGFAHPELRRRAGLLLALSPSFDGGGASATWSEPRATEESPG